MRRRGFLALLESAATAVPFIAYAQPSAIPVIGVLSSWFSTEFPSLLTAFLQGLGETGFVDGHNVAIEYRFAEDHPDRLPVLAADLVSRKVDLIVTIGGRSPALAAKNATSTVPIVFASVGDPVGIGLVANLARPGGNITGFGNLYGSLRLKLFELLTELVPRARVIALLTNPNNAAHAELARETQEAARNKGLQLPVVKAATESDIDVAFTLVVEQHADALLIGLDPFFSTRLDQLAALASRHVMPALYATREFVAAGGLICYGPNTESDFHSLGVYAGRILKGEKPADLPVQLPTTFVLAINLKTARTLGLTVPSSILARADEVFE